MASLGDFARELVAEQLRRNHASALADQRAQMEAEVARQANEFVNRRVIESMDANSLVHFRELVDSGAPSVGVQGFITAHVPNKDHIVAQALIEFRALYLGESTGAAMVYVVKEGDTLFLIAGRYGTTYQHLAAINGIANPDHITVGQVIRLP